MKRKTAPKKTPAAKRAAAKRTQTAVLQAGFLAAFSETGNVAAAARAAGCARADHYRWMVGAEYAAAFESAKEEAIEAMELEARRRAVDGVFEPVVYQGQFTYQQARNPAGELLFDPETGKPVLSDVPLAVRKHSDVLLMFLLKAARPDTYRENAKVEISGSVEMVIERLQRARKRVQK
jgi:hypothetical protein